MNTRLLQKCIDKLNEDKPDLSYVKGILETLMEMSGESTVASIVPKILTPPPAMFSSKQITAEDLTDEEREYHTRMAGGPIAQMRDDAE